MVKTIRHITLLIAAGLGPAGCQQTAPSNGVKLEAVQREQPCTTEPSAPNFTALPPLNKPQSVQPPTGRPCRVFLRRDALGFSGAAPLGPNLDTPAHREAVVSGVLDQVTQEWVVLKSDQGLLWIPRNVILMIEVLDR